MFQASSLTRFAKPVAALALAGAAVLASANAFAQTDPVVLTFSTVGDSRQDPTSPDSTMSPLNSQDAIWLQNTKAFGRILRTIQSQKPTMLFFNGDMIMGYGWAHFPTTTPATVADIVSSDVLTFYKQYAFWRGMTATAEETGTYIVPVPGNHEVQCKSCGKVAKVENETAWGANMGDLVAFSRFSAITGSSVVPTNVNYGPVATSASPSVDGLTTDQSKLSYSFDYNGSHFAVINTDPVGSDAHAPANWLSADLSAAQGRGLTHFFVFGHKAAYTYKYTSSVAAGALDVNTSARDAFWSVIEQYGATYFCGHEHIFNIMQPNGSGHAYQVIVGSGGSPFDQTVAGLTTASPTDRYYAWATVKVHQSGKVEITAYGFSDAYGPTQLLQDITLPH